MAHPVKEFHICTLGKASTGKTSLLQTMVGVPFNRKTGHKPSMEDEPVVYSVEALSSAGLILFHFYDWAWEEKRRDQSINQQLMRGKDGALFLYDVTDRRSKGDFGEYSDWYHRAAGFDKPWVIVSNKNDQKKKAVQDGEGQALARQGDRRAYAELNLVDNIGVDEVILCLSRLMLNDLNLTIDSFRQASAESLSWSAERASAMSAGIGMGGLGPKSKKVVLVVMNRAVIEKFSEILRSSTFELEPVGNAEECEELILENRKCLESKEDAGADHGSDAVLPICAILVPPTASDSQKAALTEMAAKYGIGFASSVPRNALDALTALL